MSLALEIIGGICLGAWILMLLVIALCLLADYERRLRRRLRRAWHAFRTEPTSSMTADDGEHVQSAHIDRSDALRIITSWLPSVSRRIH